MVIKTAMEGESEQISSHTHSDDNSWIGSDAYVQWTKKF